MRILVTNDDGYDAPGLITVASALIAAGHDVMVGAPKSERSGSGSSLGTIEDGSLIPSFETTHDALGAARVIAMDCPPALAVVACCAGTFGPPPELVISGINPGHNTGRSILFSSTVGALLAARVAGIGGLAVSCGFAPAHRYDTAAEVTVRLVEWMVNSGSTRMSLNVNVPDIDFDSLAGVRVTRLGAQSMFSLRTSAIDDGVLLRREERHSGFRDGTDSAAVADGCVSVTALRGVVDANEALLEHKPDDTILGALEML